MRDMKMRYQMTGVENATHENAAPSIAGVENARKAAMERYSFIEHTKMYVKFHEKTAEYTLKSAKRQIKL